MRQSQSQYSGRDWQLMHILSPGSGRQGQILFARGMICVIFSRLVVFINKFEQGGCHYYCYHIDNTI